MMDLGNFHIKVNGYLFRESNFVSFVASLSGSTPHFFAVLGANSLTLLHSERPKLYTILAFLSAIGLRVYPILEMFRRP